MSKNVPIPENEKDRLAALNSYDIMDTLPEGVYDNITKLASIICETPIALISLVNQEKQWFKAEVGLGAKETPRDISFCQYAIMGEEVFEVSNAKENPIFSDNPLVTGDPNIRFYAGTPLKDEDGYNLGTLCVIHTEPKKLSKTQKEALDLLGKEVIAQFTIRRKNIEFKEIENYFNKALDLICIAGDDGFFKKINPSFTEVLGYSENELLDRPFASLIHPEDVDQTSREIQKLVAGGKIISFINRFKTKKGNYVHLSWNADIDKDSGNMFAVARDVTSEIIKTDEIVNLNIFQNTVLDGADYSIIATDKDGTITAFNKGAQSLLGYSKEEVIGKTSPAIFHDINEVVERSKELSEELKTKIEPGFEVFVAKAKSGGADINEWTYITKTGQSIPVELSITALFNSKNEITGYLGIGKNLTDQKNKIAEIERLKNDLDFEIKAINNSALRVELDVKGKIISANDNFLKLTKYKSKDIIDLHHSALISKEEKEQESYNIFWDNLKQGVSQQGIFKRVTKNGTIIWIRGSYIPVKNSEGKIDRIIKIAYDVSESISLQEDLKNAVALAKQATIAKDEFLANMSHEIRTPMNAIVGFTELIESTELNDEQIDYLSSIKAASGNLLTIINDILDFAKIESGQLTLNSEPFIVSEALNLTKKTLKSLAQKKGLSLQFFTETDLVSPVLGDVGRLNQVLVNLIGNAIKFTEKGGVQVFTSLLSETNNSYEIEFKVKDSGIGIAEDKLDKIFSRFQQAEEYTTRKYGGTGLGLSISSKIIEALGGKLKVESKLGEGSEFSFVLMCLKTKSSSDVKKELNVKQRKNISNAEVLLIEDNPLNQILAKQILIKEGVNLTISDDGKAGVEEIINNPNKYDVVLMDLQMPIMNGYEATKHIRNELKLNIPIIAMTAHSLVGEQKKCIDLGMNDYISKPYTQQELLSKLSKFINHNNDIKESSNIGVCEEYLKGIRELSDGNEDFVLEMVNIFLKNVKSSISSLNSAGINNDKKEISAIAHKLKSSFGMFKMNDAYNIVTKLELIENYKNKEDINQDIQLLNNISSKIFNALELYLKN